MRAHETAEHEVAEVPAQALVPLREAVLGWTRPHIDLDFETSSRHFAVLDPAGRPLAGASAGLSEFPVPGHPAGLSMRFWAVAVDPAHQGAGHGRRLMQAVLDHGRRLGADSAWANARESAIPYYLAMGFEEVGERFADPLNGQVDGRVILSLD